MPPSGRQAAWHMTGEDSIVSWKGGGGYIINIYLNIVFQNDM